MTVSGPGFLSGLVALANATTNCFPVVQISGSSERHIVDLKRGDYEELDQMAAAERFAKAAYRVDRAEDIGRGIARAIRTAVSGRPGGVYLDIPAAVLGEVIDTDKGTKSLWRVVDPAPRQLPAPKAVNRAIALLAREKTGVGERSRCQCKTPCSTCAGSSCATRNVSKESATSR